MLTERRLRLLDLAVVVWVAAWIGLGVAIGINLAQLTDLSHTVRAEGAAVQTIGGTLKGFGSLPLVGSSIGRTGQQVQQAGASAVASGQSSASSIQTLSVLLAIAVALLPSVPVIGLYLPMRLRRRREARALREAARRHGSEAAFQALLAQRALARVDYRMLVREPALLADLETGGAHNGDRERLAGAELRRLGIDPSLLGHRSRQ